MSGIRPTLGKIVLVYGLGVDPVVAIVTRVYIWAGVETIDVTGFPAGRGGFPQALTDLRREDLAAEGALYWDWPPRA